MQNRYKLSAIIFHFPFFWTMILLYCFIKLAITLTRYNYKNNYRNKCITIWPWLYHTIATISYKYKYHIAIQTISLTTEPKDKPVWRFCWWKHRNIYRYHVYGQLRTVLRGSLGRRKIWLRLRDTVLSTGKEMWTLYTGMLLRCELRL